MGFHILVTGSKGFVGRNFVEALKAIKNGRDSRHTWDSMGAVSYTHLLCARKRQEILWQSCCQVFLQGLKNVLKL